MKRIFLTIMLFVLNSDVYGGVVYYETNDYRGRLDNPFVADLDEGAIYVEDFESQGNQIPSSLLTTPYATGWNGNSAGSPFWGVYEDYSIEHNLGYRWTSTATSSDASKAPNGIHFDFNPNAQGRLPEYVGAALLGRFDMANTGQLYNSILVYDSNGVEVTDGQWRIPAFSSTSPPPPEDYFLNFYGIHVPGGISRILFRDFLEVDHLTYGYSAIPEPAVTGLAATAVLGLGLRRRRRQT